MFSVDCATCCWRADYRTGPERILRDKSTSFSAREVFERELTLLKLVVCLLLLSESFLSKILRRVLSGPYCEVDSC